MEADISTLELYSGFPVPIQYEQPVAILQFSYDNFTPFSFNGTHMQEPICYEVEMVNCVLPNLTMNVGLGGQPAFYPEFYVELSTISNPSINTLYSNNPNSKRALFRAIVTDTARPTISPFVRLKTDGTKQIIKFNPRDVLHFKVTLPDGTLVSVNAMENFSPQQPNPLMQISALFSLKKV